jgi:PhoH-like ATPase
MKKIFVLDTNVLLENPNSVIDGFDDNDLVIPLPVIEEADNLKHHSDTLGFNARELSRKIEECRENKVNIYSGIPRNKKGGLLRVVSIRAEAEQLNKTLISLEDVSIKPGLDLTVIDNLIILTALKIKLENTELETILLSNDSNVRIKASMLGIKSQECRDAKVDDESLSYTGMKTILLPLSYFGSFKTDETGLEQWIANDISNILPLTDFEEYNIHYNEFILFDVQPSIDTLKLTAKDLKKLKTVYRRIGNELVMRPLRFKQLYGGLVGKNLEQSCALDLLLDDDVKVVSLKGLAGCVTPDTKIRIRIKDKGKIIPIVDERKI